MLCLQLEQLVQMHVCCMLKLLYCSFGLLQVLIQGLQNLNRAVHQDVVAVQLLPRNQWVAPSSVVLQDEGAAKDDNVEEDEEEKAVRRNLTGKKRD